VEYWKDLASIVGGFGQLVLGLIALFITAATFFTKRRDVFKTELSKAQFEELGKIRMTLQEIWFDLYYVSQLQGKLDAIECKFNDMKTHLPDEYEQYERYKKNSNTVFYKLALPNYYLFPDWICKKRITVQYEAMKNLAPFTLNMNNCKEELIKNYANETVEFIKYLDEVLKKNA
jgi:hypothetical protein